MRPAISQSPNTWAAESSLTTKERSNIKKPLRQGMGRLEGRCCLCAAAIFGFQKGPFQRRVRWGQTLGQKLAVQVLQRAGFFGGDREEHQL